MVEQLPLIRSPLTASRGRRCYPRGCVVNFPPVGRGVSRQERGIGRVMPNQKDEVNVYAGGILVFVIVSKKVARKLLKKHGSKVTVREVEEFGMMIIEPVPF